jgi:hypothetical protein
VTYVALGDLDGDGDLDALVANVSAPNQIRVNDGSGIFTASDVAGGNRASDAVALGDLDGDGGAVLPPDPAMAVGPSLTSLVVEPVDPAPA